MTRSRIFIGGLPPGTTSEELVQRFKSFGDVKSSEVVPDKEYPPLMHSSEPMVFTRNFGFITIEPKDEKSLQRAISVYNGSLWRGCTLRCKLAKPTMMERLAEEEKEEEEQAKEEVDHTLPQAVEGTTLRIRQPNSHELVSVILGGSELKLEKLGNTTSQQKHSLPSLSTDIPLDSIVSNPLKPRKTFEQHLQECAEKYAASEEGQRAAAARQDRLDNTKEAAAQDQETAVTLSLKKDAALALAAGGGNRKGQQGSQGTRTSREAGGRRGQERLIKSNNASVFPMKRSMDGPLAHAPPSQRTRVVDFLSDEDFTAITTQKNLSAAVDLSRFGSDSDGDGEDDKGNGNDKPLAGVGLTGKMIPQVDGAADSSTGTSSGTSSSSSESSDDEDSRDTSPSLSSSSSDSDSDPSSSDTTDSSKDDEMSSESDSDDEGKDEQNTEKLDLNGGSEKLNKNNKNSVSENGAASWMAAFLPAGASFFRQDALVQVEAAWRAGREGAVREFKERRRQALRQAGKSGGGGTGGKNK